MTETNQNKPLFEVKDLVVEYHSGDSIIHAVNGVSFDLKAGETLGLVGETGAGKTSIARASLRILPEYSVEKVSGEILYNGKDVLKMNDAELRALRGEHILMFFQSCPVTNASTKTTVSQEKRA